MKTLYFALAAALAFAGGAFATGAEQNTNYVTAGPAWVTAIWCKAGGHNYAPIGDASEYGDTDVDPTSEDPIAEVFDAFWAYYGWSASGEPECLAGDMAFGIGDDHGWFGSAFCVAGVLNGESCGEHRGHALQVSSNDAIGSPNLYISTEECDAETGDCTSVTTEGCGAAGLTIPSNPAPHWQSKSNEPAYLVWVYIDGVYVNQDTAAVCLGSAGTITANY